MGSCGCCVFSCEWEQLMLVVKYMNGPFNTCTSVLFDIFCCIQNIFNKLCFIGSKDLFSVHQMWFLMNKAMYFF